MKGYVWYREKIHSGTKEEYLEFCQRYGDEETELVMTLYDTTPDKLKIIADNLNKSNFIEHLKNRGNH